MTDTIGDLIHRVEEDDEFINFETEQDAMDAISAQVFFISHYLEVVHQNLLMMAQHFSMIAGNVNSVNLYDHSVKINEDLF